MSAGPSLQARVRDALLDVGALAGVWDAPPARADFPYVVVDCGDERDWSTKDRAGREVALALTLWDDRPARLQALGGQVEAAAAGVTLAADGGWQLVTLTFVKRRVRRQVAGPWALALDFRARLLARSSHTSEGS